MTFTHLRCVIKYNIILFFSPFVGALVTVTDSGYVYPGIGGSKGAPGTRPTLPGSKFFHLHAVFGKKNAK